MVTRKVKLDNLVIDWVKPRVMVPRLWFCSSADVLSRIECLSFFKSFFQILKNRFHVFSHKFHIILWQAYCYLPDQLKCNS